MAKESPFVLFNHHEVFLAMMIRANGDYAGLVSFLIDLNKALRDSEDATRTATGCLA